MSNKILFLIRHGDFIPSDNGGILSKLGEKQSLEAKQILFAHLEQAVIKEFKVYSSPKYRAMQTAAIVFPDHDILTDDEFFDDWEHPDAKKAMESLFKDIDVVIAVTHLPNIEYFLQQLIPDFTYVGQNEVPYASVMMISNGSYRKL